MPPMALAAAGLVRPGRITDLAASRIKLGCGGLSRLIEGRDPLWHGSSMAEVCMNAFLLALPLFGAPQESAADTAASFSVRVAPAETLAVTVSGIGPTVLFVPGLLGGAFGFRHVTRELAEGGHRVIVVEPLGTGDSSRPDDADYSFTAQAGRVAAVMDSLRLRNVLVVVHTVGAPIGYRLAISRPDLVSGILSINGGPVERLQTPGVSTALKLAPLLRIFGAQGRARSKLEDGLLGASGDSTWVTEAVIEEYGESYREDLWGTLRMLKRMSEATDPEPLAPNLSRIDSPVLLLLGAARPEPLPPDEMTALRDGIPALEVREIEGAGQYIHEEQPQVVVDAIREMIMDAAVPQPWTRSRIQPSGSTRTPAGAAEVLTRTSTLRCCTSTR
jgi:pimeloyl-ACP methyl ester carboxylesterase